MRLCRFILFIWHQYICSWDFQLIQNIFSFQILLDHVIWFGWEDLMKQTFNKIFQSFEFFYSFELLTWLLKCIENRFMSSQIATLLSTCCAIRILKLPFSNCVFLIKKLNIHKLIQKEINQTKWCLIAKHNIAKHTHTNASVF